MNAPELPTAPLPIGMNIRLSAEMRTFIEEIAADHDLTLSGAIRHVLELAMTEPTWVIDVETREPLGSWRELQAMVAAGDVEMAPRSRVR